MTDAEKLAMIKLKLNIDGTTLDSKLQSYLNASKYEILNWMYINSSIPEDVTSVPTKYEMVQVEAVVVGFNLEGGENEKSHNENGINRAFKYSSMVDFIHAHVYQLVG